jgi:RNA polymerase sigma-70 factor, ECF subfamily
LSPNNEEELITMAQEDRQAFVALYERYVDRIFRYIIHMIEDEDQAKDITSATFEKALRGIGNYRYQGVSFGSWLYRIARNEILQHSRRKRLRAFLHPNLRSEIDVERQVFSGLLEQQLFSALNRLSKNDRDIITLRFLEQLSTSEVSAILNCSSGTTYVRLHRALARLKVEYEKLEKGDNHPVSPQKGRKPVFPVTAGDNHDSKS